MTAAVALTISVDANLVQSFALCHVPSAVLREALAHHGHQNLNAIIDAVVEAQLGARSADAQLSQTHRSSLVAQLEAAALSLNDSALAERFAACRQAFADSSGSHLGLISPEVTHEVTHTASSSSSLPLLPVRSQLLTPLFVSNIVDVDDDEIDYDSFVYIEPKQSVDSQFDTFASLPSDLPSQAESNETFAPLPDAMDLSNAASATRADSVPTEAAVDDDDDDEIEGGEARFAPLVAESQREYDTVGSIMSMRDLAHSKPVPPLPRKKWVAPPATAYEVVPPMQTLMAAKSVAEFAAVPKSQAARALVALASQKQFERLCAVFSSSAGVPGALNERADAAVRGVQVGEWVRFADVRVMRSVLAWLAVETEQSKTVTDAVMSRVHKACDANADFRHLVQQACAQLQPTEVEAIFKHLDTRDCAWFLGGAGAESTKRLPISCAKMWAALSHSACDVLLVNFELPSAKAVVHLPAGLPAAFGDALMTAADTILHAADAHQSEIVWLGKSVRDDVAVMHAELALTNLAALQSDAVDDDGGSVGAASVSDIVAGGKIRCLKSVGVVPVPPDRVLPLVSDLQKIAQWDPFFESGHIVEQFGEHCSVRQCTFRAKRCSLVRARSFVFAHLAAPLEGGGWLIAARSVQHARATHDKSTVRGIVEASGWLLLPDGNQNTLVTHITLVAFGGKVPQSVYNLIQSRLPMGISHLRKLCAQ